MSENNTLNRNPYTFTNDPTVSGLSKCDTDVLNEDIMYLKWRFDNETPNSLFDLVTKDHELSYAESEGYEKLGNYVYKDELTGVHYGYPEFYNRCLAEFDDATEKQVTQYSSSNVTLVGNLGDKDGILYRFSVASYAKSLETFAPGAVDTWEMVWKFKTFSKYPAVLNQATQWLVCPNANFKGFGFGIYPDNKLFLYLSSNGTSWNIANFRRGTKVYEYNKEYYWKLEYDGEKYIFSYSEDGETWITEIEIASTSILYDGGIYNIGIAYDLSCPWLGSIDLNESYIKINSSYSWKGTESVEYTIYEHANGHTFYDISEKTVIDNLYAKTGMAWLYGIDSENERILLPRNDYYYKNDTPGKHIDAGLPDIQLLIRTNGTTADSDGADASLGNDGVTGSNTGGVDEYLIDQEYVPALLRPAYLNKDITYGNSDTVQPASVGVIVYMVVGTPSLITAIEDINIAKDKALQAISGTAETAIEQAGIATQQAGIATNKAQQAAGSANTATQQAGIATTKANETAAALAEAEELSAAMGLFTNIDGGNLDTTPTEVIDGGTLDDTPTVEIDGGTLDDLFIAKDDIKNIVDLPILKNQTNGINKDLAEAKERITTNEESIKSLQAVTDIFNVIDGGNLDTTPTEVIDGGTLDDYPALHIDGGNLDNMHVTQDNLRDTTAIPHLLNVIADLTNKLNGVLAFIEELKDGIDGGDLTTSD